MRKLLLFYLFVINVLMMLSCWPAQRVPIKYQKVLNQCYDGNYTGLDSTLSINGYYKEMRITKRSPSKYDKHPNSNSWININDTNRTLMIFFKDGTCVYNIGLFKTNDEHVFFNEVLMQPESKISFMNSYKWGVYKTKSDTIYISVIDHIAFGWNPWTVSKVKYKIENSNTLRIISMQWNYSNEYGKMVNKERNFSELNYYVIPNDTTFVYPATFIPLDSLPNSDCWLKKNKWFWCDEDKYNQYMLRGKKR